MTSLELSAWLALFTVRAEEAKHQKDIAESGDGQVIVSGLDDDELEELEDDGET